jgi:hypothetical protein
MPRNNLITFRKGTSDQWVTNPILASGEPGWDSTNNILKIGNGQDNWLSLPIVNTSGLFSVYYDMVYVNNIPVSVSGHNHTISDVVSLSGILENKLDNDDMIEGGFF